MLPGPVCLEDPMCWRTYKWLTEPVGELISKIQFFDPGTAANSDYKQSMSFPAEANGRRRLNSRS
jgi:hypothetical protein